MPIGSGLHVTMTIRRGMAFFVLDRLRRSTPFSSCVSIRVEFE